MVSSCSIWSPIFKTAFVFDVRPFLLLSVKFEPFPAFFCEISLPGEIFTVFFMKTISLGVYCFSLFLVRFLQFFCVRSLYLVGFCKFFLVRSISLGVYFFSFFQVSFSAFFGEISSWWDFHLFIFLYENYFSGCEYILSLPGEVSLSGEFFYFFFGVLLLWCFFVGYFASLILVQPFVVFFSWDYLFIFCYHRQVI